jgi:hypothetical protein
MVLKVGHFGKYIRNKWKILKSGAGEVRRRSVGPIVRNEEVLHTVKEERNILNEIKRGNANWICHMLRRNCLVKEVVEGKLEGSA